MPRACTICAHPERRIIDGMIANKKPYLQIATNFRLNQRTVNTHGKNHVEPFIESVELQAQATVLARVMNYRDEVNLPLAEKSKLIEDRLWGEYFAITDTGGRMTVMREIHKQQDHQAKLAGAYQKEKANPSDAEKAADIYKKMLEGYPDASEKDKRAYARMWANTIDVDPIEIDKHFAGFSEMLVIET